MRKTLIIEDDERLQKTLIRMIQRMAGNAHELVVDLAVTAEEAISLLEKNDYHLILSDYQLLLGNGGDVYDWVKKNKPAALPDFFFCSGSPMEIVDRFADSVQNIGKPFNPEDLRRLSQGRLG